MCTAMIARVRGVMRASTSSARMHQQLGSASTSTGVAPARTTASAQEMIVNVGMMTSSPGSRASASMANSNAAVPLLTATPYARSQYDAHACSNRVRYVPADEIQPERSASMTASISGTPMCASGRPLEVICSTWSMIYAAARASLSMETSRSRAIVMIATPDRMMAAAASVRSVTDSWPITQPRNTATTGLTYAYVDAFAAVV